MAHIVPFIHYITKSSAGQARCSVCVSPFLSPHRFPTLLCPTVASFKTAHHRKAVTVVFAVPPVSSCHMDPSKPSRLRPISGYSLRASLSAKERNSGLCYPENKKDGGADGGGVELWDSRGHFWSSSKGNATSRIILTTIALKFAEGERSGFLEGYCHSSGVALLFPQWLHSLLVDN